MTSFALISEGITDQVALQLILESHYSGLADDDIDVNPLQPARDATDQSRVAVGVFGNWENVLEYCSFTNEIIQAFGANDYLVIQIDTDCGDLRNFDVPLTDGGKDRPDTDLIADVRAKIAGILGPDIMRDYGSRIVFAICVHSLECWLLPLHEAKPKRQSKNCLVRLERAIKGAVGKDYDSYDELSQGFRKKGALVAAAKHSDSLGAFLDSLPKLG